MQQPAVAVTGSGLKFIEVVQQAAAAEVVSVVDDGLDPQRTAVFHVLLDPGVLAEDVEGDRGDVPVDRGLERPAGLCPLGERLKMISVRSGRPMSRLPAISASKNARVCRGAANTRVREISTWRMVSSRQNPAARPAAVSGSGSRDRKSVV